MSEKQPTRVCAFQDIHKIRGWVDMETTDGKFAETNEWANYCGLAEVYMRASTMCRPELCPLYQTWKYHTGK